MGSRRPPAGDSRSANPPVRGGSLSGRAHRDVCPLRAGCSIESLVGHAGTRCKPPAEKKAPKRDPRAYNGRAMDRAPDAGMPNGAAIDLDDLVRAVREAGRIARDRSSRAVGARKPDRTWVTD